MSIQIIPYKLTHGELEARLAPGLSLLPGQLLRFEGMGSVYGQVTEVRGSDVTEGAGTRQIVQIALLRGSPSLNVTEVTLLTARQMVDEASKLIPDPEHPLDLGDFQGDYIRLGALTLIEGDDFVMKYQALLTLMQAVKPYQKIVVLDPLGIFEPVADLACYTAGDDIRLGLQQVSGKRFLEAFGGLFPEGVRKPVIETVAAHWPESGAFSGFSPLLVSGMITESLLKNLILQNCAHVIRNKLFAEAPDQVLDLKKLTGNAISVLDLSPLQEPWKRFFYQEVVAQVFANPELGLVPVLIYPENYLPDLNHWVKRADELEFRLLALTSPYLGQSVRSLANNIVTINSAHAATIKGELTLNLPVAFGAEDLSPLEVLPFEQASVPIMEPSIEQVFIAQEPFPVEAALEIQPEAARPELAELFEAALAEAKPEPLVGIQSPLASEPHQFFNSWQQAEIEEEELEPVAETSEMETPSPHPEAEDFAGELSSPVGFVTPIVDLSAPTLEAIPAFLTAEQLSDLLSAPPLVLETELEADPLEYPDAEEGAIPEDMGDGSNFPALVLTEPAPSMAPVPTAESLPIASTPEIAFSEPPAPLPSFPVPEEFEKDEFDFDINLDQKVDQLYEPSIFPDSANGDTGLGVTVSKSLNEFDRLNQAPEAPLLDFDAEALARKLAMQEASPMPQAPTETAILPPEDMEPSVSSRQEAALSSSIPEPPQDSMASGSKAEEEPFNFTLSEPASQPQADEALQEALDSIYPRPPESSPEVPVAAAATALANPTQQEEESVPVIQRKQEASVDGLPGFKAGDKVRHPNYGLGIVQKVIPIDHSVVLNITFENVGKRLLDPALTELSVEPAG